MKPILFPDYWAKYVISQPSYYNWSKYGKGVLVDAISCTVTEERNGMYELEMVYPTDGQCYSDIHIRDIIVVVPYSGGNRQPFRIYQITKPINKKVTIKAQHISYDLSKMVVKPFSIAASSTACNDTLQGLKTNGIYQTVYFNFWTDVDTVAPYNQITPASIRSRLGGVEGSVLDQFHGEYEWDQMTVKLHADRGSDNGVVLRYGKNITDINQDINISKTITSVVPFWSDYEGTNVVVGPEVYAPNASSYSDAMVATLDFSTQYEEAPTYQQLRTAAEAYINAHDVGVPEVSITVSFVNLADTEEYKDQIIDLQRVKLCDTITVEFEELGISTKAKIVKYEWDVLAERYNSLSVGSVRSNLVTTLNNQNTQLMTEIVKSGQAAAEATSWLTKYGGYVVAVKDNSGQWAALAFSNDPDPTKNTAQVLLINQNGLGFSSHGLNGPFYSAWTLDGHLTLGGINNEYGTLTLMGPDPNNPSQMVQIGKWDKDGISATKGSFSGSISGSTISFGAGSLQTQMKYGPSASFGGSDAFLIVGNDRMAIESSAYQVRVAGASFHGGTLNGNAYIDINDDYAIVQAQTGSTIRSSNYVSLTNGTGTVTLSGDKFTVNGAKLALYADLLSNQNLIFRNISDNDEAVILDISGALTNALEHLSTGRFVKWTSSSDRRSKEDVRDLNVDFVRDFINKIRPVNFKYKKDKDKKTHYGLIAQELEEVFNDLSQDTDIIGELSDANKTKFIDYPGLIGICLSAIKDLYARVSELESKIKEA